MMKRILLAAMVAAFAIGSAAAQESCESKAVGQGRQATRGSGEDLVHEKVHGRYMRDESRRFGWQGACRSRKDQLHEEVREGRVSERLVPHGGLAYERARPAQSRLNR